MALAAPRRPLKARYATVPKLWPGGTIVCIGSGPSLTQTDCEYVRGKVAGVIAVNDAVRLAPWADVLYGCDSKWWHWHRGVPTFTGLKYTLQVQATVWPGVQLLRNTGRVGLELAPDAVRTGHDSGYQAINVAVHLGATRIVLLGYDMRGGHFFGSHPDGSKPPFSMCIPKFANLREPLKALGIAVVNCSRVTVLDAFPCAALEETV